MRCLDSGTIAPPRGRVTTIDRRHRELRTCGSCGRAVPVITRYESELGAWVDRLAVHGSAKPRCPQCGSSSPQHHVSDHEAADGRR